MARKLRITIHASQKTTCDWRIVGYWSFTKSPFRTYNVVAFSDLFLYNHPDTAMPTIMSFRFNLMRSLELFVRQTSQINCDKVEALLRLFVDCVDAGFTVGIPWERMVLMQLLISFS